MTDKPVTLAVVTGAHGVTGEVRLKLFGDGIGALKGARSFNDGTLTPTAIRPDNKGGAIARFAEIADRNAAERLRGTALSVPRAALPKRRSAHSFAMRQLIGPPHRSETTKKPTESLRCGAGLC